MHKHKKLPLTVQKNQAHDADSLEICVYMCSRKKNVFRVIYILIKATIDEDKKQLPKEKKTNEMHVRGETQQFDAREQYRIFFLLSSLHDWHYSFRR